MKIFEMNLSTQKFLENESNLFYLRALVLAIYKRD